MNNANHIYVGHSDPPHSPWKFIPDTPEERQRAIKDGYTAASTMSFAYEPEKGNPEPLRHGSLFLDFDSKVSPALAIGMAREFVERVVERHEVDPECLRYWMSGGKGCHIEIPAAIYGGEAGHPDLPIIQKTMLMLIGRGDFHYPKLCEVLDFQLYCQGKGKLLRLPNIERPNGRYKVPVSFEEFFKLDYSSLERLTQAPRIDFDPGTKAPVQSPRLTEIYDICVSGIRNETNRCNPISGIEALFKCAFIAHCFENQATLSEPHWWAMISILSTFGDLGRKIIHLFSQGYSTYSFEETDKKISRQRYGHKSHTCSYIKSLGFDCGKTCGVRSPADLWKHRRSEETLCAMKFIHKDDGLYRQSENGHGEPVKICSPMEVLGKVRNPEGMGWARLVKISTSDRQSKEILVYMRDMKGRGDDMIRALLDNGLEMTPGPKTSQYLMEYIMDGAPRDLHLLCVQQIGWLDSTDAYVLPDAVFGGGLKEKIHFQADGMDDLHQAAGTLSEWHEHVGGYCRGNSLLEFLVSYALTGPLLKLVGLEGGGLHVYGASSSGKTTAAIVTGSVCGGGGQRGFTRQWRATHNALESVATLHNDNLLILDEISQANPDTVSQVAYMLANGQGKDRLRNDASRRKTYRWLLNFLSTGEQTINDKIQEFGKSTALAGQEVRVIDLPIDGLGNAFQSLHGLPDSGKFSELLSRNARLYYGSPLRAFLEKLCANIDEHRVRLERDVESFVADCCPPEASGQVRRVARKFGLIAAAGELGISFGVLPLEAGTSEKAAADWFKVWLSHRNGLGNLEVIRAIERIQDHLTRYADSSRFVDLDARSSYPVHQPEGYVWEQNGKRHVLLIPPVFNDLAKGANRKALMAELDQRGYLAHNNEGNLMETKCVQGSSKRGVVFIPSAWDGEPTRKEIEEESQRVKANMEALFS